MKSIPLEGRIWLLSLSSLPDRIQSLYVLSLRTPTLHFFSKLTCKNFLFRRFRDTALFFFPFLSGLKKPCVRTFPDARLLIFFSMFLCLFLMFSLVLRMNRIFWFLQRGLSKKCQRGVLKNMWIIQTPLRTAFHDTQRLLLEVYISNVRSVFVFFAPLMKKWRLNEFLNLNEKLNSGFGPNARVNSI